MDMSRTVNRRLARSRLGLDTEAFIVLQLGRMVPREGIENVVRAMALLPREIHPQLLVVAGDADHPDEWVAPEVRRLRVISSELGVDDIVSFDACMPRSRLRERIVAADVCVSTPCCESFGMLPLEAMACGTPVIGSELGGLQDAVIDGVTGYLIPPNDAPLLAEHLLYLHAHPALAHAFGAAGMRHAQAISGSRPANAPRVERKPLTEAV